MQDILGDLWPYPFNADVWGNAADWTMVAVTAYTLSYLRRTLRSQLKVQELQQTTTNIENEKFRIEIEPRFQQMAVEHNVEKHSREIIVRADINMLLQLHDARNVNIGYEFRNCEPIFNLDTLLSSVYAKKDENFHIIINLKVDKSVFDSEGARGEFFINYEDIVGNKYSNRNTFVFTYTSANVYPLSTRRVL